MYVFTVNEIENKQKKNGQSVPEGHPDVLQVVFQRSRDKEDVPHRFVYAEHGNELLVPLPDSTPDREGHGASLLLHDENHLYGHRKPGDEDRRDHGDGLSKVLTYIKRIQKR